MNRRRFLSLLAVGAPSTVVAEKLGLHQRIRSYFFAPPGGWPPLVAVASLPLEERIAMGRSTGVVFAARIPSLYKLPPYLYFDSAARLWIEPRIPEPFISVPTV